MGGESMSGLKVGDFINKDDICRLELGDVLSVIIEDEEIGPLTMTRNTMDLLVSALKRNMKKNKLDVRVKLIGVEDD
jgi:hypothetical protein